MSETSRNDGPHVTCDLPCREATHHPLGPSMFQLTLSSANKDEIFSEALSDLDKSHQQTSTILQNLQKWNPATAALFTLRSPSTILSTPFRLVYPNEHLCAFDEAGLYARQFLAISYCWHSPDFQPGDSGCHDVWPVKKSIVDAIWTEKPHPRVGIWMDQLCIDQSSSADKRASVAAMDIIYRSCLRLVILLEDVLLDEQEIRLVQKYDIFTRSFDRTWNFEPDDVAVFASFYDKVDGARWWSRAWCFHEFSVHQPWTDKRQSDGRYNATFILCGPNDTTVKIKWVNLQLLMGSAAYVLPNASGWVKGQAIFAGVGLKSQDQERGWRSSIMARHNGVSDMGSSLLEDRLSIMMNLCGLGLAYVGPGLGSTDEIFYLSTLLALAAGETAPLTLMHHQSMRLQGNPTWLSKHTVMNDITIPGFKIQTLTGIHQIQPAQIELDMLFLDAPWESIKPQHLAPTYTIFPHTIPTTPPATHISAAASRVMSIYSYSETDLDLPRRRFLAGCILSGARFTTRLWTQIQNDIISPNYNTGAFKNLSPNPTFTVPATRFLTQLFPISTLLGISQSSHTFTPHDAALFLTWLSDPRSMYYIGLHTFRTEYSPRPRPDFAFINSMTCNQYFRTANPEQQHQLRIAIPTHLLASSCIPLRAWILQPVGVPGVQRWRLVGKALVLGEGDLEDEARGKGERVRVERVVVCG
ncbi:hypothetical protein IAQ61_004045 [Plenodomus lingam]|uniref:Heterokaryon incompatibility domain-containing protein n=1 Tax=Leptosphaeria maculans (strain JN3 / isolate v23.1.3 / race Av1-4-5-6-7-8) TaxID=985895 RepID=E4ZX11_LEPMJ|nr:hypothetical protein LEMA_P023730.1 [Plenodomus lingam JN3]KAH9873422.1 hypothetical protein IAQ61_004045 [Plenodomus lingam]CBX95221.1 hypothetical protein LEMA_P023730.1 [Plenodomus lingam JN3]